MEDDVTVTLVIALSQTSSVPFEVTVNTMDITATGTCDIATYLYVIISATYLSCSCSYCRWRRLQWQPDNG